jgi:hypothetical protein
MNHMFNAHTRGELHQWFSAYSRDPRMEIEARIKDVTKAGFEEVLAHLRRNKGWSNEPVEHVTVDRMHASGVRAHCGGHRSPAPVAPAVRRCACQQLHASAATGVSPTHPFNPPSSPSTPTTPHPPSPQVRETIDMASHRRSFLRKNRTSEPILVEATPEHAVRFAVSSEIESPPDDGRVVTWRKKRRVSFVHKGMFAFELTRVNQGPSEQVTKHGSNKRESPSLHK